MKIVDGDVVKELQDAPKIKHPINSVNTTMHIGTNFFIKPRSLLRLLPSYEQTLLAGLGLRSLVAPEGSAP